MLLACGGGDGAAEMICTNNDGLIVVNDKYTCAEWCDQGEDLLVQAESGCGGDSECSCTFAPGETCIAELGGTECVL